MSNQPASPVPLRTAVAAATACIASLALFWPGVAMYDTVAQYRQVVSNVYDDWHPPVMARLWAVLAPFGRGATPMLVVQFATYWLGLGLLAAGLARTGRWRAASAMLAIGVLPPFLGWQGVVLKDAQLVGALLAAVGLIGWWRLRDRAVPRIAWIPIGVLTGYAVLVRANAVFAVGPLLAMLLPVSTRPIVRSAAGLFAILVVLATAPLVNHQLLGADHSGVERTQALYDLAGIAARIPEGAGTGLTVDEAATVIARHCASPFFWDPLGDDAHCGTTMARLRALPLGSLYATLAQTALHHPLAYAGHRFAHLNSTERWLVPAGWPGAAPPLASEPNTLGLTDPGPGAQMLQRIAAIVVETPLGWPVAWLVVAVTALAAGSATPRTATNRFAIALLVSAVTLEASFAVLSIASDLRYHLWSMIATAVGVVLLADRRARLETAPRWILTAGAIALAMVVAGGTASRLLLPYPPQTYAGMLG